MKSQSRILCTRVFLKEDVELGVVIIPHCPSRRLQTETLRVVVGMGMTPPLSPRSLDPVVTGVWSDNFSSERGLRVGYGVSGGEGTPRGYG